MWRLMLTAVLWNTITSQPITDDSETARQPRQLDFRECCPCPGSNAQDLDTMMRSADSNDVIRSAAVDDCPCRFRGNDAQGASSVFFPRAVRPVWSNVRPDQTKEDPKPLLHPEVDFASSVLETLRDATDEEYQEALAREAARNAARVSELRDVEPEAAKVVTIIVNPQEDDAMPEASRAQEARCVHPLGLGQVRETELKTPIFKLKPNHLSHRNLLDMDSGASNVQEHVVSLNKGLEGLRLKTTPDILKLLSTKKSAGEGNIQSMLNLRNKEKNLPKDVEDVRSNNNVGFKIPNLKLHSLLTDKPKSPIQPLGLELDKFKIPKIKIPKFRKPILGNTDNLDSNLSPSVIQEQVAETTNANTPRFELKSLFPTKNARTPFSLKNFLNLKDVELIGPNSSKTKITLPDLKLLPPLRVNKPGTSFTKQRKHIGAKAKKNCDKSKAKINALNITSRDQNVKTEILDALPNPSENHEVIAAAESNTDISTAQLDDDSPMARVDGDPATQILDAVPNAFEQNGISLEDGIETTTPVLENTNSDGNTSPLISGEANTSSKLSSDNLENSDRNDGGIEFIMNGDDNTAFEEFEIIEQTDQPFSEIDVSGSVLDGENPEIGQENIDDFESEIDTITLNADDIDSIVIDDDDETRFELNHEDLVETEDTNNPELFREKSVNNQVSEQDTEADTSNQAFQVLPVEDIQERVNDSVLKTDSESTDSSQSEEKEYKLNSMQNVLPSVKERISVAFKTLKNPNAQVLSIKRFNQPESEEDSIEENSRGTLNSEETVNVDSLSEDTEKFPVIEKSVEDTKVENKNNHTLPHAGNNKQLPLHDFEDLTLSEVNQADSFTDLDRDDNVSATSKATETIDTDMDSSATSNTEAIMSSETKEDFSEIRESWDDINLHDDEIAESTCPCTKAETAKTVSGEQIERDSSDLSSTNTQVNEMASEASESLFNVVPNTINLGSSLLQQNIVQPSSLFDVNNLFPPVQPLDITNLQIPTLSDITSGISSLFSGNERAAEEEELTSTEIDSIDDCSNTNPSMASDASTTSLRSSFAPLKPLEDINLDIFQINPFAQASPFSPKIPSLNLNTFKTKLALPKSLGLKPMKLQSALEGKNGGLVGATLTFGSDKLGSSSKAKPVFKLNSILDRQGADILGNSLANMPSLEDLRATMRANTQSLLSSPLVKQISNPIEDTLQASQTLGNSLRSHTENQMRNLQQSLASTLNEAQVNTLNKAGGKFAKPQDLLEMVSTAHDDMNDKLHAIHIDLKDRLESIHDRIKEHTNLPTLRSPLLSIPDRFEEEDNSPGRWKIKGEKKTSLLRSSQPTKKTVAFKKPSPRINTPKPMSKAKLGSTSVNQQIRPFKMSKAASSLTPKTVEIPKLKTTSSKPPFSRPLQRDNNVKLKESRPFIGTEERSPKPVARKPVAPFGDIRVKYSTTARPASVRSGIPLAKPKLASKSLIKSEQPSRFRNSRPAGQFKSFGDSRGFASEPKPTQIPAPVKTTFKTSNLPRDKPVLKATSFSPVVSRTISAPDKSSVSLSNPLTSRKSLSKPNLLKSPERLPLLKGIPSLESLLKPTESSLLAKMRDPIWIRLSNRPSKTGTVKSGHTTVESDDMARSASENNEIGFKTEPMKENVAYKCKMVCVREP